MTIPVRLRLEVVPEQLHGRNLRALVTRSEWERCKKYVAKRSGKRCEICGSHGPRWPVECHEQFVYRVPHTVKEMQQQLRDHPLAKIIVYKPTPARILEAYQTYYGPQLGVQKLVGLIALCPDCHLAKHYGRAVAIGKAEQANRQLMKVNGWTNKMLDLYLEFKRDQFELRTRMEWVQDLFWLCEQKEIAFDQATIDKLGIF